MEFNTEIERIYEIIDELKSDVRSDKKKLIELENHIIKLQQEVITLPKIIQEQNKSQTLELQSSISNLELKYSQGFSKYVISFILGILSALLITFLNL